MHLFPFSISLNKFSFYTYYLPKQVTKSLTTAEYYGLTNQDGGKTAQQR